MRRYKTIKILDWTVYSPSQKRFEFYLNGTSAEYDTIYANTDNKDNIVMKGFEK